MFNVIESIDAFENLSVEDFLDPLTLNMHLTVTLLTETKNVPGWMCVILLV